MKSGLTGDWDKLANILDPVRMRKKLSAATKRAGANAVSAVKKGIVGGEPGGIPFWPLREFTKERKGSSKPLIDHGDLLGGITYEEIDIDTVWVGVKKGSRSSSGGDLADIAWVHEYGALIEVTPKMRAYLHSQGLHLKPDTEYVVIPPRSFLRATLNDGEFREGLARTYLKALKEHFLP
ncbi:MAG: hypothetical protein LBL73_09735 [Synergistaceae bacterium]|jgi:hypothetical protein|nr:hypothetical protein [Synergistaceae bacterium]